MTRGASEHECKETSHRLRNRELYIFLVLPFVLQRSESNLAGIRLITIFCEVYNEFSPRAAFWCILLAKMELHVTNCYQLGKLVLINLVLGILAIFIVSFF